jgi:hypothetical protein
MMARERSPFFGWPSRSANNWAKRRAREYKRVITFSDHCNQKSYSVFPITVVEITRWTIRRLNPILSCVASATSQKEKCNAQNATRNSRIHRRGHCRDVFAAFGVNRTGPTKRCVPRSAMQGSRRNFAPLLHFSQRRNLARRAVRLSRLEWRMKGRSNSD